MCLLAGGRPVTADMAMQSALVTPEWVLSRNPDVIIKTPHLPQSFSTDARPAMAWDPGADPETAGLGVHYGRPAGNGCSS